MADDPVVDRETRRPRVSRPTPSHLFAQRQASELDPDNGNEPVRGRATRVIPALARMLGAESPPMEEPPGARASNGAPSELPPDLVLIVRADGTVLFVNRPLGMRAEDEVIGSDLYEWVFPEQHQTVRDSLARVFAHGAADSHELHGLQHHDAEAWYECRVSPNFRDAAVVSATIIARDVTRYKQAETALRSEFATIRQLFDERNADFNRLSDELAHRARATDAEYAALRRFRHLIDAAGEAMFITDARSRRVVDLNETAARWIGRDRDEVIGAEAHALGLEFLLLPDDDADVQFTETRDTRRPLILDGGVHRRGDGSTFPVEVAVAHHRFGEDELILAVVRDVKGRRRAEEALRESEERYRALVEQSWDAIYVTTRAGKVVEANAAALALFGYDAEEFVGLDARELMPQADDIRRFQREMAEGGQVDDLDVHMRTSNGDNAFARLSARCRRDASGRLSGYQWVVRAGPAVATAVPAAPAIASSRPPRTRPRDTVLFADHQEHVRDEARAALEHGGLRVLSAETPSRVLELFDAHQAELAGVVVEVSLGDPAAAEVIRALRRQDRAIAIVLVSAEDPFAVAERFSEVGVTAYLRRPVHPLTLLQTMRDIAAGLATPD
ncbi:MAG TPA: PAS domain S-box protein [Gemmatimonadales bacterium]